MPVKINETNDNTVNPNPVNNPRNETVPAGDNQQEHAPNSNKESQDPNDINVEIADQKAPLIVLFGPPSSGKTMILVRMARFLQNQKKCSIKPNETFRSESAQYKEVCIEFKKMIDSNNSADSTDRISFMLAEVMRDENRLCQILESPGEFYFNPEEEEPNTEFPNFVNTVIRSNNRKIWVIIVEPNWKSIQDRKNYVAKISILKPKLRPQDKVIFMYNKIDKTTNLTKSPGVINIPSARQEVENHYPNIFTPFLNQHPITKLWKKYNFDFVPFQTGTYTKLQSGAFTFQPGVDEYCRYFWEILMRRIRG